MFESISMNGKRYTCDCDVIHEEAVSRVREAMPTEKLVEETVHWYKMFADNTRVRILWALSIGSLCVCDLAVLLEMTKSAVSHQLKLLRTLKLVVNNKQGKIVYYSLTDCRIGDLLRKDNRPN